MIGQGNKAVFLQDGLFRQHIQEGWQIEEAEEWLTQGTNPWELSRLEKRYQIAFGGEVNELDEGRRSWHGQERVIAIGNDMSIPGWNTRHVNTLRLWSAKPAQTFDLSQFNEGNYLAAAQHEVLAETLSRVLYPDDSTPQGRELRLKQEYFFTAASLKDIMRRFTARHNDLRDLPSKAAIQLNDTHPAIAVPELMRLLVDHHGMGMREAFNITRETISYTNHTLLPEALETWPVFMFEQLLPRILEIIYEINVRFLTEVSQHWPGDTEILGRMSLIQEGSEKRVRMAYLAIVGSFSALARG